MLEESRLVIDTGVPVVTSAEPALGPAAGGTRVALRGHGFAAKRGLRVRLGDREARPPPAYGSVRIQEARRCPPGLGCRRRGRTHCDGVLSRNASEWRGVHDRPFLWGTPVLFLPGRWMPS